MVENISVINIGPTLGGCKRRRNGLTIHTQRSREGLGLRWSAKQTIANSANKSLITQSEQTFPIFSKSTWVVKLRNQGAPSQRTPFSQTVAMADRKFS